MLLLVGAAVIMDFLFDKISNECILLLIMTGLSYTAWKGSTKDFLLALLSMTVPVLVLYPVFMIGGLGAGDIKLFAAIGCFLPGRSMLICLILSFLIAAFFSLLKMAAQHDFLQRMQYLLSYLHDVFTTGSWELYAQDISDHKIRKKGKVHFALPVFISVMLFAGGVY